MHVHHLHFYVQDPQYWKDWFTYHLDFEPVAHADLVSSTSLLTPAQLQQNAIEFRFSGPEQSPETAAYLRRHPAGIGDVAFATDDFSSAITRCQRQDIQFLSPVETTPSGRRMCQVQGWGDMRHTLIEVSSRWVEQRRQTSSWLSTQASWLTHIDHVVINVPAGQLSAAVEWYQQFLGLERGQQFEISTHRSGLRSQVLFHPDTGLQLPINEPSSDNSQIQEFLTCNRGSGVQHVALGCRDAVSAIAHYRQRGVDFLSVPNTYYSALERRMPPSHSATTDLSALRQQQLLADWPPQVDSLQPRPAMLLQTFTRPIFADPTFFIEIIQRQTYAADEQLKPVAGFGEGNFQALFEAIERAQIQRS